MSQRKRTASGNPFGDKTHPGAQVNSPTGPRAREPRPKLGLAVPVHESPEAFAHLLLNLWVFIPESVVCVHLNPSAPLEPFQAVVEHHERLVGWKHAWIAKRRINHRWGGNLVPMYNLCFCELADTYPKLTHLMCLASNQLFFRPGTYQYIKKFQVSGTFHPEVLPHNRNWRTLEGSIQRTGLHTGPPEGFCFRRSYLAFFIKRQLDQLETQGVQTGCFEEVFYHAVAKELALDTGLIGDGINFTWLTESVPISCVEGLLAGLSPPGAPPLSMANRTHGVSSIFSVKRVPRVLGDPLRTFIDGLMHQHGKRYRTEAMRAY
jgi:hypothetical protein